jgi:hypothetical protein
VRDEMENTEMIETIDIEAIMTEIREKIKERGYTDEMLHFQDVVVDGEASMDVFKPQVFKRVVEEANVRTHINYFELPLGSGLSKFIKKCIRKMISFLVAPVVGQVNQYNSSVTQSLNQLYAFTNQCQEQMKEKVAV